MYDFDIFEFEAFLDFYVLVSKYKQASASDISEADTSAEISAEISADSNNYV